MMNVVYMRRGTHAIIPWRKGAGAPGLERSNDIKNWFYAYDVHLHEICGPPDLMINGSWGIVVDARKFLVPVGFGL